MLLDTGTLLWMAADQSKLSNTAKEVITSHSKNLFISSISAFEIAVKHRKGALELPLPPREWVPAVLRHHGVSEIPVDSSIAVRACELPPLHRDPCDRLIIATVQLLGVEVLTPDHLIKQYPDVIVRW